MRIPTSVLRTTLLEDAARFAFAAPVDEIDACARRAAAANGFGDAAVGRPTGLSSPGRPPAPASPLVAVLRSLREFVRRQSAAWQRQRLARGTFLALAALDDRTLHDLGFARSELPSIAVELAGAADHTRVHVIRAAARA